MSNNNTFPSNFFDPLTGNIMTDPVVGSDGRIYNREDIEEWFKRSKTSPFTRQYMDETHLNPLIDFRNEIQEAIAKQTPRVVTDIKSTMVPEVFKSDIELKTMKYNDLNKIK